MKSLNDRCGKQEGRLHYCRRSMPRAYKAAPWAGPPWPKTPPDRDDQTLCFTVPAMAVEELLSVVGLPAR